MVIILVTDWPEQVPEKNPQLSTQVLAMLLNRKNKMKMFSDKKSFTKK